MPIIFGLLTVQPGTDRNAYNNIRNIPEVTEAYMTNGGYDMIIRMDIREGADPKPVIERIGKVEGISGASYNYSFRSLL